MLTGKHERQCEHRDKDKVKSKQGLKNEETLVAICSNSVSFHKHV